MTEQEISGAVKSHFHYATSNAAENDSSVGFLLLCEKGLELALPTPEDPVEFNKTAGELPIYWRFNEIHLISVIIFSILLIVSSVGNSTVLVKILRLRRSKGQRGRINLLLLHLVVANLLITLLMMPHEIAWNLTVSWKGGDALCRILSVLRVFGLYLSGFLGVCVSVESCFTILKPIDMQRAELRGRIMVIVAWIGSGVCSVPQALIHHVRRHPKFPWYEQCVMFDSFTANNLQLLYSAFGLIFLHGLPLLVIIVCYFSISWKVCAANTQRTADNLRQSNTFLLRRARMRALKLTISVVLTSSICWLPYDLIFFWHLIDPISARQLDWRIPNVLFIIGCTSPCLNPLVYYFHVWKGGEVKTIRPQPFHSQEQAQDCQPCRPPKDSGGGDLAAAMETVVERNCPTLAENTEPQTASVNEPRGQLRSNESGPNVEFTFDPQAVGPVSATVVFHNGSQREAVALGTTC